MERLEPRVELLAFTPQPEAVCALAARTCYSAVPLDDLKARVYSLDQKDFLRGVIRSGHLSVLEHVSFTFYIENVSRALLAQLTRHRIASFSVQSQRYVSLADTFSYQTPPRISEMGPEYEERYRRQMEQMAAWYREWQDDFGHDGTANEDARFVLPNACMTRLTVTMNARELLHFFSLRCCSRAQWEIRALATRMLSLAAQAAPVLFENAGPGCVRGACPEGSRSCGRQAEVREAFRAITKDHQTTE